MSSMHMNGPYISGQCILLDKTFGGSLTQPTKSPFISQAAPTSCRANIIHIHYIQLFDKLVLAWNTVRTAPWWELDWNSESSYFKWHIRTDQWLCWQENLTLKTFSYASYSCYRLCARYTEWGWLKLFCLQRLFSFVKLGILKLKQSCYDKYYFNCRTI